MEAMGRQGAGEKQHRKEVGKVGLDVPVPRTDDKFEHGEVARSFPRDPYEFCGAQLSQNRGARSVIALLVEARLGYQRESTSLTLLVWT